MSRLYYHASPGSLAAPFTPTDTTPETAESPLGGDGLHATHEATHYALYPTEEAAIDGALQGDPAARTVHLLTCRFREGATVCDLTSGERQRGPEMVRPLLEELGEPPHGWAWWQWYTLQNRVRRGEEVDDRNVFAYAALAGGIATIKGFGTTFDHDKSARLSELLRLAGYDGVTTFEGRGAVFSPSDLEVVSVETRRVPRS